MHAPRLQVLKLEIGGDGHSTINTESSYMHSPDPAEASVTRGWETWLALEAKRRNPAMKIGGLAWSWPGFEFYSIYYYSYVFAIMKVRNTMCRFPLLGYPSRAPGRPATTLR